MQKTLIFIIDIIIIQCYQIYIIMKLQLQMLFQMKRIPQSLIDNSTNNAFYLILRKLIYWW